jgi:hypothetical protein
MKKLLFFLSLFISVNIYSQNVSINSGVGFPKVFNVMKYGADNTGTNDATAGIQAAINACIAAHGGTVWFPIGVYKIAGSVVTSQGTFTVDPNSQIYIGYDSTRSTICTINLIGEAPASPGNASVSSPFDLGCYGNLGVILYSNYTGTRSTTVKGTAILGAGAPTNFFNINTVNIENINFKAKNNPNGAGPEIGGFNAKNLIGVNMNYCTYYVDTPFAGATLPTRDISGFETPETGGGASYAITNTSVTGTKWGHIFGEHVYGSQNSSSGCYFGFGMKPSGHASEFSRINAYWCVYGITYYPYSANPTSAAVFTASEYDLEYGIGNTSKYYNSSYSVNDSLNKLSANIKYAVIEQGVGLNNARWSMNGGTGVLATPIGSASSAGGSTTQVQYNSTGALAGSSRLIWDNSNNRFTVGRGSALSGYDINAIDSVSGVVGYMAKNKQFSGQTGFYIANNRSQDSSYGMLLYGGQTNGSGNLFGVSRQDKLNVIADGVSNGGMNVGTLQAVPLILGTSNTARVTLGGAGGITIGTSEAHAYRAITAIRTLDATDYLVNCTANSFTVTLPTAVGITGRQYIIKNTGSATTITIATTSSQTIDGAAPGTITTTVPLRVMSDGANWITW